MKITLLKKYIYIWKQYKKRIVAGFNEVIKTLTTIIPTKESRLIIFPINLIENPLPRIY